MPSKRSRLKELLNALGRLNRKRNRYQLRLTPVAGEVMEAELWDVSGPPKLIAQTTVWKTLDLVTAMIEAKKQKVPDE